VEIERDAGEREARGGARDRDNRLRISAYEMALAKYVKVRGGDKRRPWGIKESKKKKRILEERYGPFSRWNESRLIHLALGVQEHSSNGERKCCENESSNDRP